MLPLNCLNRLIAISVLPFSYLPILFAAAIPLGMVKRDREVAVYSSIAGYIAMLLGMRYILGVQGQTVDTTAVKYLTETLKMTQEQAVLKNSLYIMLYNPVFYILPTPENILFNYFCRITSYSSILFFKFSRY